MTFRKSSVEKSGNTIFKLEAKRNTNNREKKIPLPSPSVRHTGRPIQLSQITVMAKPNVIKKIQINHSRHG